MSSSLIDCYTELAAQMGDRWNGTTSGAGSSTTMVDAALMAKANDWIGDDAYVFLTEEPAGAAAIYDERKISSLSNTAGTLTTLAFAAAPGTGIDYEINRLFKATEYRAALIYAARHGFPFIHERVRDDNKTTGDWLKDGGMEVWTSITALTHWTTDTVTVGQTTDVRYLRRGTYSTKLSTAAGGISQGVSNFADLQELAGKSVTIRCPGWCDTASCLRLQIYDGATTTSSDYHTGGSAWDDDELEVQATIADAPTEVTFRILHDVAAGTSYVDDARVIGPQRDKVWVDDLNLAENKPIRVSKAPHDDFQYERWMPVRDAELDVTNGYLYVPSTISDYRLRIQGMGYLDFLASGVSSTAWTATINLNSPQTDILVAEAAIYLCRQMTLPGFRTTGSEQWYQSRAEWIAELESRRRSVGMEQPPIVSDFGAR